MDPHAGLDLDAATRLCAASFEHHRARLDLPSLAWGLVRDGAVLAGVEVDAVYRIASMTKSFTAATVLMLRDAGRLGLDDPVERHAPEFAALRSPLPGAPAVTVRHLLTMSSGLATDDAWADRHLDLRDDELDAIVADGVTFAWMPGVTFEYSNLGYGVLGRVVRNITGSTLQRNVTDHFLEPLGMTRTSWTAPDDAVIGYRSRHGDEALVAEPMLGDGAIAPMGGLFSSVTDLARWVDFLASAFGPPHADLRRPAGRGVATRDATGRPRLSGGTLRDDGHVVTAWRRVRIRVERAPPSHAGDRRHAQRRSARVRFEHALGRQHRRRPRRTRATRRTPRWRPPRTRCSMRWPRPEQ